ncbi:MAG: PfkB family carbohydrate kinase [Gammaproteobacteria bacterium]
MEEKLIPFDELAVKSAALKAQGKRIVLCHGTFDLMHTGHIKHLQRARQEGDALFVTVTGDKFVNKGPGRPVFGEHLRAETLAALACVDYVAINQGFTAIEPIEQIRPDIYAKGSDYQSHKEDVTGNIVREIEKVEQLGGRVFYTNEITFSSSSLLNEHFGVFTPETKGYLDTFAEVHTDKSLFASIEALRKLKVLVVGDAIVDQYHYVSPLGQTGKGNILAVKYESEEQFAGGALAVANHLASFVDDVTLVSALGTRESHEEFIRSKLLPNVRANFFMVENAPTLVKRRFVDMDLAKFFEVYFYRDEMLADSIEQDVVDTLARELPQYDAVIVPDFGNGFISQSIVRVLCDRARFLAVNTQINSGNRGYHVINRYTRADFVSLNEPELRLAAHNRNDPVEAVAEDVAMRVGAGSVAVTRGSKGVLMVDRLGKRIHSVPALSTKVVDRIGAGDAFLSLSGLCLAGGLPADVAAFVGSAAAAIDVQIVCNREPINPSTLFKFITTLLK